MVAMAAVAEAVATTAMAMVTVMAVARTSDQGSSKVARGKQATAKVKRRSSSAQQKNQPITKRRTFVGGCRWEQRRKDWREIVFWF